MFPVHVLDIVYGRELDSDNWNDNLQSLNQEKNEAQNQSFTQIARQFQSLERQVYVHWTSVPVP